MRRDAASLLLLGMMGCGTAEPLSVVEDLAPFAERCPGDPETEVRPPAALWARDARVVGTLGAIGEVDHRACIFDAPDIGRFGASFSLGPATTFFMWVRPAAGLAAFPIGTGGSPEVFANAFTVTRFVTSAFVINPPMVDDATVDETATAVVTDDGEARIRVDFEAENDRTPGTLTLTFQTVADANGDPVTTTGSTRP